MRSGFSFLLLVIWFVRWTFEAEYIDRLEFSTNLVSWTEVSGPYVVTNGDWSVRVDQLGAPAFFRVKRSFRTGR